MATASLKEMLAQKAELERQIEEASAKGKADAIVQIRALMDDHGLTMRDLGGQERAGRAAKSKTSTGAKVAAKYRNQASGETWSGRGLQPRWLKAALASGKKLEDFAV
jgi:DNA-binding protein H-NS